MTICLKCGKESDGCLCNTCRGMVNIEDLCRQIIEYRPGNGENQLWDQKASELNNPGNFMKSPPVRSVQFQAFNCLLR